MGDITVNVQFKSVYIINQLKIRIMKAIQLTFVVKGIEQVEIINVNHISRILVVNGAPFIGMVGQTFTRQITVGSYEKLVRTLQTV